MHKCEMKKYVVSSKKWVDCGGGRGYGYKQSKVTKYRCMNNSHTDGPTVARENINSTVTTWSTPCGRK